MIVQNYLQKVLDAKIIPVIRNADKENILSIIDVLIDAGIRVIEITVESAGGYEAIQLVAKQRPNIIVGAGTVWNVGQAEKAIKNGAKFIFSPFFDKEVVHYTKQQKIISIPGVFTPSEIYQAYVAGADLVKIFPIDVLGARFIKSISQPLPPIPKIVTGGVNLENIEAYLSAGAAGVGIGSDLVDLKKIEADPSVELKNLEMLTKSYVKRVIDFTKTAKKS